MFVRSSLRTGIKVLSLFFSLISCFNIVAASECLTATKNFEGRDYLVPIHLSGEVSEFYRNINATDFQNFPNLNGQEGRRLVRQEFFDDSDFHLASAGVEVWMQEIDGIREYREDKRKIFITDSDHSQSDVAEFDYKRYKVKREKLDEHPLLGKIKRKDRPAFFDALGAPAGYSFDRIDSRLTVIHNELVYALFLYGKPVGEIVLDSFHIENFGLRNTHFMFRLRSFADGVAGLTAKEKVLFNENLCRVADRFEARFPQFTVRERIGVNIYLGLAQKSFPGRLFFEKYPLVFKLCQVVVLVIIGWLVMALILGRYEKSNDGRKRVRSRLK